MFEKFYAIYEPEEQEVVALSRNGIGRQNLLSFARMAVRDELHRVN